MFTSIRTAFGWAILLLAAATVGMHSGRSDEAAAVSDGPLGETPEQIVHRYGPILRHHARVRQHQVLEGGSAMDGDLYQKNGIIIRVVFQRGHAVLLEFNRPTGPLSAADVDLLLADTSEGFAWQKGPDSSDATKLYRRTDNRAVAHWTTDADGSLLIATEDAVSFNDKLLP